MSKAKSIEEVREGILHSIMKKKEYTPSIPKTFPTPFGDVSNELKSIMHVRPLRKGEILAQYIKDKLTGKKETFLWMGVVERSDCMGPLDKWRIVYRPFTDQNQKVAERTEQLYMKQTR